MLLSLEQSVFLEAQTMKDILALKILSLGLENFIYLSLQQQF